MIEWFKKYGSQQAGCHFYQWIMCVVQGIKYTNENKSEKIGKFIRHYCSNLSLAITWKLLETLHFIRAHVWQKLLFSTKWELLVDDGVKSIGDSAFNNCSKLDGVTIDNTILESIGKNAFESCDGFLSFFLFDGVSLKQKYTLSSLVYYHPSLSPS